MPSIRNQDYMVRKSSQDLKKPINGYNASFGNVKQNSYDNLVTNGDNFSGIHNFNGFDKTKGSGLKIN